MTDNVGQLLEEIRRQREPVPIVPMQPVLPEPLKPVADQAALKAAEEAKAQATAVKEESSRLRQVVNTLVGDRETLRERFEARITKVKEELGEDAGNLDVARAYLRDLAGEKLGDRELGMSTGKVLGGALGLSGPLAFGIGLGLWLVSRRIGGKIEAGEPLLIQRLVDRLSDKVDGLKDRVNQDRLTPSN